MVKGAKLGATVNGFDLPISASIDPAGTNEASYLLCFTDYFSRIGLHQPNDLPYEVQYSHIIVILWRFFDSLRYT
jgi:hypothetical protein